MRPPQRFAPEGALALSPQAFGAMFDMPEVAAPVQRDGVAVVQVRGPLMHHRMWFFDSYEAIVSRVSEALEGGPKAIVLSIDSPGGLVNGCFETARKLRAMCDDAGVQLAAYVDGQACSAAYALACAAHHIAAPRTASIGSIGVLQPLVDATRQAEMFGLKFTMIASGARKTDGHPETPTSEEAIAATQARVDELGEMFFAFVAEHRGAVSADDVRALEAGIVHGVEAKSRGLIDEVASMDDLLASLAGTASPAQAGEGGPVADDDKKEESAARRALKAIVDDEKASDEDRDEARKALAALDDEETAEEPEEEDEEASASAPAATAPAAQASAPVDVDALIEAKLRQRDEKAERAQLLASRPDLDEGTKDLLASAPIEKVRAYVKNAPRRALRPAAAAQVRGTVGEGQGDGTASPLPADLDAKVNRIMGLAGEERGVFRDGDKIVIGGVISPKKGA